MIAPAGHGAGHVAGYLVELRVIAIFWLLVLPWTFWYEPLMVTPHPSGNDPASLNCFRNGTPFSLSSQKRMLFGLSGVVHVTSSCFSNPNPPNRFAPRPGRALKSIP